MSDDNATVKETSSVELSKDAEKILEMVKGLSVIELANLVKAMEEEFGVSAAAPVAVAAVAAGGDAGGADDGGPTSVNIELTSAGGQKIAVIKAVRELTGLGLKEAKDLVDAAPKIIKENVPNEEAESMKKKLQEAGATVSFK